MYFDFEYAGFCNGRLHCVLVRDFRGALKLRPVMCTKYFLPITWRAGVVVLSLAANFSRCMSIIFEEEANRKVAESYKEGVAAARQVRLAFSHLISFMS